VEIPRWYFDKTEDGLKTMEKKDGKKEERGRIKAQVRGNGDNVGWAEAALRTPRGEESK